MRVEEGGDGGSFLFLDTREHGARGPAPFLKSWVEPNLRGTFAVGIDVHNPPSREMFTPWGNYQDRPQREVSLHWDGREIAKRVAPEEFRGRWVEFLVALEFVAGGAEATVRIAGGAVFEREFVPGMVPYEMRLAAGAGTRADASTTFDLEDLRFEVARPAAPRRPPVRVRVFDQVLTDNAKTAYEREVALPPAHWAFARVILTIDIHDAGEDWDEWDRNGEVSVFDDAGVKRGIVPFITSYRTPCHWEIDVTHFRPLLAGRRRIEVAAGTTFYKNRGYRMSVTLDFHHGIPDPEPWRVVPLWVGTARHGLPENHFRDFFEPRRAALGAETTGARLFVTVTGHSQVGEFTSSRRTVVFAPRAGGPAEEERRYASELWKTDCYLNPNRPQFGTWQFSRAGWAPGDWVRPWWIDLTEHVRPGDEAEFRYEPEPYEFGPGEERPPPERVAEANQVVRAYLIEYRAPSGLVAAPSVRIASVQEGSNAARHGVREGDWLESYDGRRIDRLEDLRAAIDGARAAGKERVEVVVHRGGESVPLSLEPGPMGVQIAGN
jgi:hypothetical protein